MRINDKIKDYYDIGQQFGQNDIFYDRKFEVIKDIKMKEKLIKSDHWSQNIEFNKVAKYPHTYYLGQDDLYLHIIGFCEKLIPIILPYNFSSIISTNFTCLPILKKFSLIGEEILTKQLYSFKKKNFDDKIFYGIQKIEDKKELERRQNQYNQIVNNKQLQSLFFEYKSPIFLVEFKNYFNKFDLYLNPKIGNLNFGKYKNAVQAYQDIEIFLSNRLIEYVAPKVPVGSDKVILESKGFDKFSFRKDKKL